MPRKIDLLNENDKRLLELTKDQKKSVNELARELNISPSNVSIRIDKLLKLDLIEVEKQEKQGKKTYIRTKDSIKTNQYVLEILTKLKDKGGEVSEKEFLNLLNYEKPFWKDKNYEDKTQALWNLELNTKYVQKIIRLTEEGKKYLEEKSKSDSKTVN